MHEIEPSSFCTMAEYRKGIEKRKQPDDLSLGGLYLVLAALREGPEGKEAFKFPIRMKIAEMAGLLTRLTVDILNVDLQSHGGLVFLMENGISLRPPVRELRTNCPVEEMYIKDYEDYISTGPGETSIEEELVGIIGSQRELVLA